jgi:DNA polymerase-3 subunit delta'
LPWLSEPARLLRERLARERLPQSLLIHGRSGLGRRHLALWLAAQAVRTPASAFFPLLEQEPVAVDGELAGETLLVHPDCHLLRPPPGKQALPIDGVRALIQFLHLSSHAGGQRVAIVWPAEAMTTPAANSLLKTLEEPPAGSLLILVAEELARLPPTILSRCQRWRVNAPTAEVALAWLATQDAAVNWAALLDFAGGAPLTALLWHQRGLEPQLSGYRSDLQKLRQRADTATSVAQRWAAGDPAVALRWLYLQAAAEARAALTSRSGEDLQSAGNALTMRALWRRVHDLESMYRQRDKSLNFELQLAALLQHWTGPTGQRAG